MKWTAFSILDKSKKQYKRGDSRFPLWLPSFFSCYLSQDRISPLEAAVYFEFQSLAFFIVIPSCPCLCQFAPTWTKELLWARCQVTPLWVRSPRVFAVWHSGAEMYKGAGSQSTQHYHMQHCCVLMLFGQDPSSCREFWLYSSYFPQCLYTSFQTEIKMQWGKMHHTWSEVVRHLFVCAAGGKRTCN